MAALVAVLLALAVLLVLLAAGGRWLLAATLPASFALHSSCVNKYLITAT
jgi:hypothetical protein